MLALDIRFLTGRYAASAFNDAARAEWPPHPARVFSALTAALYDTDVPSATEEAALEWLALAGAPDILASGAHERIIGQVYVPTNDQRALSDVDSYIEKLEDAESAVRESSGPALKKTEKALAAATRTLHMRSVASADDDGRGVPATAVELINRRLRPQPRRFPAMVPEYDTVRMIWPGDASDDIVAALDRVAARVARLGHSSSLVTMRVVAREEPRPDGVMRWRPDDEGDHTLRVPVAIQLDLLRRAHAIHRQVEHRTLPFDAVRYRADTGDASVIIASSSFSADPAEWLVFDVVADPEAGRPARLDVSLTQHLARALRGTILSRLDPATAPPTLTGHDTDGTPTARPHLAFVPLADVRSSGAAADAYATGTILGIAVVPPRDLDAAARRLLLEAVYDAETDAKGSAPRDPLAPPALRLTMGRNGHVYVRRMRERSGATTLQPGRWTRPARRWQSATAVALSRNPGDLLSRDTAIAADAVIEAERIIARDCVNAGLPEPVAVWVHRRSLVAGSPPARRFTPFPLKGNGPSRVIVHAELVFAEPVRGPVLIGAGRFFGLGLFVQAGAR
jgi:CRISPR-associated protein Csb2